MIYKIVFMGSSALALPTLEALFQLPQYKICALYTQPPKYAGRGQKQLKYSPIYLWAQEKSLPLYIPNNLQSPDVFNQIMAIDPDYILVIAYGKILPLNILNLAKIAAINLHGSLLPLWRGATPLEHSNIYQKGMGLTTMLMSPDLDAGNILLQLPLDIDLASYCNWEEVKNYIASKAIQLVLDTLDNFFSISPIIQDQSQVTWANKFTPDSYKINWNESAAIIARKVFILQKMFTYHNGKQIKVVQAMPLYSDLSDQMYQPIPSIRSNYSDLFSSATSKPGTVLQLNPLLVQCGKGILEIIKLQRPGSKSLLSVDFLRGYLSLSINDEFSLYDC